MAIAAAQLREQIERTLRARTDARLELAPRLVCPGAETGYQTLDAVLRGGLPVAGTTEIIGSRSSGRATLAAAYLAERTREGHVCAWVDVGGDMCPEAALADGIDMARVLWVRCTGEVAGSGTEDSAEAQRPAAGLGRALGMYVVPVQTARRDRSIGTPGRANRPLAARVEQVNSDRAPARRGAMVLARAGAVQNDAQEAVTGPFSASARPFARTRRPWSRLEQGIKAVDLLVQAGGFGAIVMDLGGIAPEFARRIPLATWFRWRAALERGRSSLLVLSQACPGSANPGLTGSGSGLTGSGSGLTGSGSGLTGSGSGLTGSGSGLTGSSAELVLRVEAELPEPGTVMQGVTYRLQVARRRFAEEGVEGRRKGPARASAWESRAPWVGVAG